MLEIIVNIFLVELQRIIHGRGTEIASKSALMNQIKIQ